MGNTALYSVRIPSHGDWKLSHDKEDLCAGLHAYFDGMNHYYHAKEGRDKELYNSLALSSFGNAFRYLSAFEQRPLDRLERKDLSPPDQVEKLMLKCIDELEPFIDDAVKAFKRN